MIGIGIGISPGLMGGGSGITYYVDPSFVGVGDGSYASPWDDFAEVNALSAGELLGATIAIKSGEVVYDQLSLAQRDNVTVTTYGGTAPGIVDGSIAVTYTWTNITGTTIWRTDVGTPASSVGLFINDVATRYCGAQAQMEQVEYGYWFGANSNNGSGGGYPASGSAYYVMLPAGIDPSVVAVRIGNSAYPYAAAGFTECDSITLDNVHFRRGQNHVVNFDTNTNVAYIGPTIHDCVFSECGRQVGAPSGNDLLNITGSNATYRCTAPTIYNNVFRDNVTSTTAYGCNGVEFNFVSAPIVYGNTFKTIWGNAIELYRDTQNGTFKQNTIIDFGGKAWWLAFGSGAEYSLASSGNVFENNIAISTGNLAVMAANWGAGYHNGPNGMLINGGDNRAYNNTFVLGDAYLLTMNYNAAGGNSSFTARNNVLLSLQFATNGTSTYILNGAGWSYVGDTPNAAQELNINYNRYWLRRRGAGGLQTTVNGATTTTLAAWQALDADLDANSTTGDPLLSAFMGTGVVITAVTSGTSAVAQAGLVTTNIAHGLTTGEWVSMPTTGSSSVIIYSRVSAVPTSTTFRMEYWVYGAQVIGTGVAITRYPDWATPNVTPGATPPLNSGIGSATDSNVPTVDISGNVRSTTTPEMGAVEV